MAVMDGDFSGPVKMELMCSFLQGMSDSRVIYFSN
jgi:hypothetical protein